MLFIAVFGTRALDLGASWWLKIWSESYENVPGGDSGNLTTNVFSQNYGVKSILPASTLEWPITVSPKLKNLTPPSSTVIEEVIEDIDLTKYLGIYVLLSIATMTVRVVKYIVIFYGGLRASKELYVLMLDRVFHARLRYFDRTHGNNLLRLESTKIPFH